MSVKVAVRVRPFNTREKQLKCQCVVEMQNATTQLKPYGEEQMRNFTFDYSFWSFDEFQEEENGYLRPTSSKKYADQEHVNSALGKSILENAWEGYHCCLFAYGQTGAGKSYSMIGYGQNKGIVPITCEEMFKKISSAPKGDKEYEVKASMIEIYNEEVQDLTIPANERPSGGLRIRQNKVLGVYVDGIKKHFVSDFSEIERVMEEGTKNRTVAATQMNATSSRAHTIISIEFKQIQKVGGSKTEKISMINLVDLAGSERLSKTGAKGDRLKEAVGINQSLTSLGQVISTLAENAEGKNNHVPYRNSALTRILQNALGGNSQTIMICAISPASDNYDETLSTLRYAQRAKKIKNKPIVNESESDKLIKQLKAENERLMKLLEQRNNGGQNIQKQVPVSEGQPKNKEEAQKDVVEDESDEDDDDLQAKMKAFEDAIAEEQKPHEQKVKEGKEDQKILAMLGMKFDSIFQGDNIKKMEKEGKRPPPFLTNISKDRLIDRKIKVLLSKPVTTIGRTSKGKDIEIGGRDVENDQARIIQNGTSMWVDGQGFHVYLNGSRLERGRSQVLKNGDILVFGWNSVFVYFDPNKENWKYEDSNYVDWMFVKILMEQQSDVDIDQSDTEEYMRGDGGCCEIY